MTTVHQKKQDDEHTLGSIVTGIAEAVAIVGVAVTATMALKDEKTREKVKKTLINVKDQTINYIDTFKTESKTEEGIHTVKKIAIDTKKVVDKAITGGEKYGTN
jgi:hypothetical protein